MAGLLLFGKMIPLVGGVLTLIGFMLLSFGTMLGLGAAWLTKMGNQPVKTASMPAQPLAVPPLQ